MSKAIKFRNNTYLDSSSIIHNKTTLKSILDTYNGRKFLEWKSTSSKNLNDDVYITPGLFTIGGSYSNCYTSGTIYGVLMVLTNDGGKWRKTDSSSWLWQIIITTGGSIWMRRGINGSVPEGWTQDHYEEI